MDLPLTRPAERFAREGPAGIDAEQGGRTLGFGEKSRLVVE
jgi:hypothetical protein